MTIKLRSALTVTWIAFAVATSASAKEALLTVHVGPPALGNGGPNPVSIPPINPTEWEVIWLTESDIEWNFAVTPGLMAGKRAELPYGMYVGMGGGLVLDANGAGPGIYSSFGINTGHQIRFNAEVKQAVGYAFGSGLISPYAIRLGVSFPM